MNDTPDRRHATTRYHGGRAAPSGYEPTNLADILDRILDKGLVIAGDISISLAQVELITIKIRLLIASADKAKEMGIDWWTTDPSLSSMAGGGGGEGDGEQDDEKAALQARVAELEQKLAALLTGGESVASRSEPIGVPDLIALSQQRTSPPAPRRRPSGPDDDADDDASADADDSTDDGGNGETDRAGESGQRGDQAASGQQGDGDDHRLDADADVEDDRTRREDGKGGGREEG